ncbi:uncharacterized protein LOC121386524 [Gigantopelta aegis]|uniref:uncharacterized protein LOC121386524 n=1 Tax=Gigantopelta aegis TaxID=1735272 RepID=UPI001B88A246|nr:uncharacterized protein LOC121386524 [Gigantopelta aegis]
MFSSFYFETVNMKLTVAAVGMVAFVFSVMSVSGAGILKLTKSMAVIGQPLILKYENDMTNITQRVAFVLGTLVQGVCEDLTVVNGLCGSGRGHTVTRISSHVITLEIPSFDATVNAGTWKVQEGLSLFSNELDLTAPFATIVTIFSINTTNALPSKEQINSEKDFNVSTVIDCAFPSVNVSWVFGDSQTLTPVITTDGTGCKSSLVKTIAVLTMNAKSITGLVNVLVRLIHQSFENENEVLDILIGFRDFPDDPERMSALGAGAISGIVIAVVLALVIPTAWILYKRKKKKKAEDMQNESNN